MSRSEFSRSPESERSEMEEYERGMPHLSNESTLFTLSSEKSLYTSAREMTRGSTSFKKAIIIVNFFLSTNLIYDVSLFHLIFPTFSLILI